MAGSMRACTLRDSAMARACFPTLMDRSTLEPSLMDSMKERESMFGHQARSMSASG